MIKYFKLFSFLLLFSSIPKGIAQADPDKSFSYVIWIREYQEGWIDSENSFWLIESSNPFKNVQSQLEVSSLCRPIDFVAEACCNDETFSKNKKGMPYSGEVWEVRQFFDAKETIKFKVGDKTVKIVKLVQSNCKCSYEYVSCYTGSEKVAAIFSYKFLKLSREEKKNFRRDKSQLVHYLEQEH